MMHTPVALNTSNIRATLADAAEDGFFRISRNFEAWV